MSHSTTHTTQNTHTISHSPGFTTLCSPKIPTIPLLSFPFPPLRFLTTLTWILSSLLSPYLTLSASSATRLPTDDLVKRLEVKMVSLRRRRLLGLCSGNSSFVTPLPLYCENPTAADNPTLHAQPKSEQPVLSDDTSILDSNTPVHDEPGSSYVSCSSSSKELLIQQAAGPPIKRRKRHRRKNLNNQEPCLMRGVYFKNMKWQAAIKVDKKQIHLGTVGSQEEAAHLYDRAAFMCGREPNFELPQEEKMELRKFKWEEFLAMTRQAITRKKHKRRLGPGPSESAELPPFNKDDLDSKQGVSSFFAGEDAEQETSVS